MENEHIKSFIEFQKECPESIPLNKEVSFNKVNFKYADLASIMKVVKPIANRHGFILYHKIEPGKVSAAMIHENGEQIESATDIKEGLQAKDKGAEITYAKRYTLSALCGVVTEDDSDAPNKTNSKPKMNKAAFDAAKTRMQNSEPDVLNKCVLHFDLSESQKDDLSNLAMECNG